MKNDSICFQDKCKMNHKQLICSKTTEDQSHFQEKHYIQLIHYGTQFFRSFNQQTIIFNNDVDMICAQLQQQYLASVQQMTQIMKANFQQCQTKIRGIYEFNHKNIGLDLFLPHLQKTTSQTELCLELINWKKDHPSSDIKTYIENMPKTCMNNFNIATNRFAEFLLQKTPPYCSRIDEKSYQPKEKKLLLDFKESYQPKEKELLQNLKQSHQHLDKDASLDFKENSMLIQQIHNQNIQNNIGTNIHFELQMHDQQLLKIKPKNNRQMILIQLAKVFCKSQSQLKYIDIKKPLLNKISTRKIFQRLMISLMNKICLNIEQFINKQFGCSRMGHRDRVRILTDLKNYLSWMNQGEQQIFIRFIRFSISLDKVAKIHPYEVYVIYVLIITRVIQKMNEKCISFQSNSPLNLKKEIIYLCMHYGDFVKVRKIIVSRYPFQKNLNVRLKLAEKEIMVDTYHRLNKIERVQNRKFYKLLNEETDFSRKLWKTVVWEYVEYQIYPKVDKTWKEELENIMNVIVKNKQPILKDNQQIKTKNNSSTIEKLFSKVKLPQPIVIDLQDDNFSITKVFGMKNNKEKHSSFIELSKIVKSEQMQNQDSGQYEIEIK